MGVSGAGKSTIGALLAQRLARAFLEGDSFHPPANVEKMRRGIALTDADRLPWLRALAAEIDKARMSGKRIVVTCSALKRAYRENLAGGHTDVLFVYLKGAKEVIAQRLAVRAGHFMPPLLLDSQFAALEEPAMGEPSCAVDIDGTPAGIVAAIMRSLGEADKGKPVTGPRR
jgi:carbohydrate kinase (thermoresistant glucokinase family)